MHSQSRRRLSTYQPDFFPKKSRSFTCFLDGSSVAGHSTSDADAAAGVRAEAAAWLWFARSRSSAGFCTIVRGSTGRCICWSRDTSALRLAMV